MNTVDIVLEMIADNDKEIAKLTDRRNRAVTDIEQTTQYMLDTRNAETHRMFKTNTETIISLAQHLMEYNAKLETLKDINAGLRAGLEG